MNLIKILFCLNFSLILLHEMDAIRCKEWKMFIVLKDMKESYGYLVFALIHLPLYFLSIAAIFSNINYFYSKESIWIDLLLILHSIIHFIFKKNRNNEFNNLFSQCVIYVMSLIAIIRIILIL